MHVESQKNSEVPQERRPLSQKSRKSEYIGDEGWDLQLGEDMTPQDRSENRENIDLAEEKFRANDGSLTFKKRSITLTTGENGEGKNCTYCLSCCSFCRIVCQKNLEKTQKN